MNDQQAKDFLIETVANFFKHTHEGQCVHKDFLQFLAIHIEAFERHDHRPDLKDELIKFCEDTLDLSNIASQRIRDILRQQKTWSEKNRPSSGFSSDDG